MELTLATIALASFAVLFSLIALALTVCTYIKLRLFTDATTQIPMKMDGDPLKDMAEELSKAASPNEEELSWQRNIVINKQRQSIIDPEDTV